MLDDPDLRETWQMLRRAGGDGQIRLERDGPIATLTIDHPEARNALSGSMMAALAERVAELEAWEDGVGLIVRGAGEQAFCAGADLKLVRSELASPERGARMSAYMHHVLERLRALPLISVAAIERAAVGGGAELCTACDHRVLTDPGRIWFVHARLGASPGWGGGSRLTRLVGRQRALRMMAGALPLDAPGALGCGLVDLLAPTGQAVEAARALLAPYLEHPISSVRAAKRVVAAADTLPLDGALANERGVFAEIWGGDANRAAVARARQGRG